jgi:hypothetical protein
MKTSKTNKFVLLISSIVFMTMVVFSIQSCIKDNFDLDKLTKTEYSPNIAAPLLFSSLTVQDILTNGNNSGIITVDKDNFCTIIYRGNLFSLKGSSLVKLPDQQSTPYSVSLTPAQIAVLSAVGTFTASYSQTVSFSSGTTKVDSLDFKSGNLILSLNSDLKYSGQISINIPTAKKNGISFSKNFPFTYSGTTPVIANTSFDLKGYTFDMTLGGTTSSQFEVNYSVILSGGGGVSPPITSEAITICQSLNNLKFNKIFGDIGQQSLSPDKDTVDLSIFKNTLGNAKFTLVDPSLKILISNSYGIPIRASIAQLDGYNPPASTYPITGSPNPLPIQSPNFSQIGKVLTDSFLLNKSNSPSLITVINKTPKNINYQISSLTNPSGPSHNNFVLDSSYFKVDMEVKLPLWGTAKDFTLIDTLPITLDKSIPENIESALFRIYNSNGFPFDIAMQAYFTDTLYKKLDSLVIPNQLILQSATVNAVTGIVISPTPKTYDAVVNHARLLNLKNAKHVLLKAAVATTNGGKINVKIYSNYKIDVKLGMQLKLKAKI